MNIKVLATSIIILVLLLGGGAYLLKQQTSENLNGTSKLQNTGSVEPASRSNNLKPLVSAPQPNSKVTSPLEVKGTVPSGWMFEVGFPVKLLDSDRNIIVQTQASEVVPGSWTSGKNVEFSADLTFTTDKHSGFLVLEKDNPSGLEENDASFEMPINF